MPLALLAWLVVAQAEAPPAVHVDPGWAKGGAVAGFVMAAVPAGLGIASVAAMWSGNQTAQDWLQVGAGVSAPLVALIPTFAGRSASLANEELERRPRIFRIIGWVMVIYGGVGLLSGVAIGRLWSFISEKAGFSWGSLAGGNANVESTAVTIGRIISTFTTLFSVAVATAGVVFVSLGAKTSADRAVVVPTAAFVPLPGGGYAAMTGLSGRF